MANDLASQHRARDLDPPAETSPSELAAILAAAQSAAPVWAAMAEPQRSRVLDATADALDAATDELVETADAETALGETRLRGEMARTTGQLRMFAELIRRGEHIDAIISEADPAAGRPDVRRISIPVGPVAVFSASNFPFAFSVAGGDTASALAAGCPVVVKAHEGHPLTSRLTTEVVLDALAAAGAPAGVFATIYGFDAGRELVAAPTIKAVGFTGSLRGGKALLEIAQSRPEPIPFYGELGSINPVVVLPGAASARAAEIAQGYVGSLTLGVGQFCTNPGLLFIPQSDALLDAIAAGVDAATGGTMLNERIHDGYVEAVQEPNWRELDQLGHGTAAVERWTAEPEVRHVTLERFQADQQTLTKERFGPVGLVVTYKSLPELLQVLPTLPGSLSATVHASDAEIGMLGELEAVLRNRAGRLIFNGWPTGVAVVWAMEHGGPWPATTAPWSTSVGATAIRRWLVPVAYQDWPDAALPAALRRANPLGFPRTVQPA